MKISSSKKPQPLKPEPFFCGDAFVEEPGIVGIGAPAETASVTEAPHWAQKRTPGASGVPQFIQNLLGLFIRVNGVGKNYSTELRTGRKPMLASWA